MRCREKRCFAFNRGAILGLVNVVARSGLARFGVGIGVGSHRRRNGTAERRKDDRCEEFIHEDTCDNIACCEKILPERRVDVFIWYEQDREERGVAVRFPRIRAVCV